jgi:hypothetical protein
MPREDASKLADEMGAAEGRRVVWLRRRDEGHQNTSFADSRAQSGRSG